MPCPRDAPLDFGFVRPSRTLLGVMLTLLGLWLTFALALNWGGASRGLFDLLCGNTDRILHGEVWRLFTAPLVHEPQNTISHILYVLIGLLFLAPSLEQAWGGPRMLRFLALSALVAYVFQLLVELALPAALAAKLVGPYWYGAMPVVEAVAIAWALSFRGQTVRLMLLIPVSSTGLIVFVVAVSAMTLLAGSATPSGLVSPFGGMLAGWLLGGGSPSPLRRAWLKLRLKQIERRVEGALHARKDRVVRSKLRVIEGGKHDDEDDDGPGGKLLN